MATASVLIAGLCTVAARGATSTTAPAQAAPGPHDEQQAAADGTRAGTQQSNSARQPKANTAGPSAAPAAAPGSGATVPGFVSFHVYATQYAPNTPGSFEVAVPDKCVKFAALGWTSSLSQANCGPGYPTSGPDYRVFVSSDDTGKNAYVPVKDTGPWNIDDNYWDSADHSYPRPRRLFSDLAQGLPEAQAAFYNGYNTTNPCKDLNGNPTNHAGGSDQYGRCVLNPSAIDLSFAAASQLGMTGSGWVTVSYLWEPNVPGYTVDGWGGVHPYSGAPSVPISAYWQGWDIVRGIANRPDKQSGFTLDGWGGVHPFGNAPLVPVSAYWNSWDITRSIAVDPGDASGNSGYVLDGWGGVHPFGNAPAVTISAYWQGWDIARGIVVNPRDGSHPYVTGYVLDGWGGIHPFWQNGQASIGAPSTSAYWQGWDIANGITSSGVGQGYVVDGWGGVHQFGGAPALSLSAYWQGWDIARGITFVPGMGGGYVVDGWGGVHPFGPTPPATITGYWPHWDIVRGIAG